MKTCQRCHSENFEDVRFCNFCGFRLPIVRAMDFDGHGGAVHGGNAEPAPQVESKAHPQVAYRYFLQGRKHLAAGEVERAIASFETALEADPGDPQVRILLKRAIRMRKVSARRETAAGGDPDIEPPRDTEAPQARSVSPQRNEAPRMAQAPLGAPAQWTDARAARSRAWLETLKTEPPFQPATWLDKEAGDALREIGASALIVFALMAFGYLLVF